MILKKQLRFTNGVSLCASYSLPPNKLGLCGPRKINMEKLFKTTAAAVHLNNILKLRKILEKFEAVYPYLCFIAKENKIKDPFDVWVVEAYWLGNELLENISYKKFIKFLEKTFSRYLPWGVNSSVWKTLPSEVKPIHQVHVYYVFRLTGGVRKLTPVTKEIMEKCKISLKKINGQYISFHWDEPCQILTPFQLKNFYRYNKVSL